MHLSFLTMYPDCGQMLIGRRPRIRLSTNGAISGGDGAQNYIFIRLADILLLKAEAENELGNTGTAADLVNQIRTRVHLHPTSATSQADMRLAIEKNVVLNLLSKAFVGLTSNGQVVLLKS
ncbi:MAG: RagB/SusD family nutrient uptake outer membrane protein [Saprospiraceae bacterium]|uniref:RagB/SusD family nutrient uptake outer membrane protein n=1 Tax=Candidatus Opimibacter skivensis TaxID=2982028 RepID=A0A9D7XUS5_9BACT|nr:RagB/SusD family nutrient uptake outer membrane protein [Candidatus Opimibacter skivensis]